MKAKLTDKEFREFTRDLGQLMIKYNIKVKSGSAEIVFGLEGSVYNNGVGYPYIVREVVIAFTEFLTTEQAKEEKEAGTLLF